MIHAVQGYRGAVTSPHHLASQAGLDILRDGGSAIEAAVAMAAALAVVYPHMTGIGGDGFWIIAEADGSVSGIDACGPAAKTATLDIYDGLATIPARGPLAALTVPGTIGGWARALDRVAQPMPLERLLRDAVHYAETGVAVTAGGAAVAAGKSAELAPLPGAYSAIFEPQGRPLQAGQRLVQSALADTLRRLARDGLDGFYRGALAADMAADLKALGSPVSADDLADYGATCPKPLHLRLKDVSLYNMTPPTQGLASLLILALFDRMKADGRADDFAHVHGLVEATKQAFLLRDREMGDPAYMTLDPQGLLEDGAALDAMAARIDPARALPWPHPSAAGDTVWFGAVDGQGQTVSVIQSTYFEFGSGIVLPRTGITMQNRGSSFRLAADGWNALRPGRKPFHTLNPALARFDDGRIMSYGTMGGEGQPQTQAAIFTRYARLAVPLQQAISAPRWLLGRTWGEDSTTLKLEDRFDPALYDALRAAGHAVEIVEPFTSMMGHAGALVRHPDARIEGAADPRSDGAALAW